MKLIHCICALFACSLGGHARAVQPVAADPAPARRGPPPVVLPINEPSAFREVHARFSFVPPGLPSVQPSRRWRPDHPGLPPTVRAAALLPDGTVFLATTGLREMAFLYVRPDGGIERSVHPGDAFRFSPVSPRRGYLWFFQKCGWGYDLKAYDVATRQVHDVRDLLKDAGVFRRAAVRLAGAGLPPAVVPGCLFDGDTATYDIHLSFTQADETRIRLFGSDNALRHQQVTLTLPPLPKLLALRASGTPFDVQPGDFLPLSEADWSRALNPLAALNRERLEAGGGCVRHPPVTNVQGIYGLPDPSSTLDGAWQLVPFHYHVDPRTSQPSGLGEGSASTATSVRLSGYHLLAADGCLWRSFVHGAGVVQAVAQHGHFLVTSMHPDLVEGARARLVGWDLRTGTAAFTLEIGALAEVVQHILVDEAAKEVIGVFGYPAGIQRWKVPQLF
jgi:hypothetical protein